MDRAALDAWFAQAEDVLENWDHSIDAMEYRAGDEDVESLDSSWYDPPELEDLMPTGLELRLVTHPLAQTMTVSWDELGYARLSFGPSEHPVGYVVSSEPVPHPPWLPPLEVSEWQAFRPIMGVLDEVRNDPPEEPLLIAQHHPPVPPDLEQRLRERFGLAEPDPLRGLPRRERGGVVRGGPRPSADVAPVRYHEEPFWATERENRHHTDMAFRYLYQADYLMGLPSNRFYISGIS